MWLHFRLILYVPLTSLGDPDTNCMFPSLTRSYNSLQTGLIISHASFFCYGFIQYIINSFSHSFVNLSVDKQTKLVLLYLLKLRHAQERWSSQKRDVLFIHSLNYH